MVNAVPSLKALAVIPLKSASVGHVVSISVGSLLSITRLPFTVEEPKEIVLKIKQ